MNISGWQKIILSGTTCEQLWDKIASEHAPTLVNTISMARVRFDRPLSVFYDNLLVNTSFRFPDSSREFGNVFKCPEQEHVACNHRASSIPKSLSVNLA